MQKITLNSNTRGCTALKKFLGYEGENDANKLVFVFADGFIDGTAILNIKRGEDIGYVELDKIGETYEFPIKNSILGQVGEITFQLALTTSSGKRIIYDELVLEVKEAIEADIEMPEDYPSWKSLADTKIAEINEAITQANAINMVASKEGKVATINITKKDGTTQEIQIFDGEIGPMGPPISLSIGTVEKGEEAKIWITGEAPNQVLHFILPKGDTGKQGEKGETGNDGANGKDGTEIELQTTDTYIQWRYVGTVNWNNLIALSLLEGKDGDKGKNLEFNWKGTSLGVRQEGQAEYTYVDLEGKQGKTGPAGTTDYNELDNTPSIPKRISELENDKGYINNEQEQDPTVPSHVKNITQADIQYWNDKSNFDGNYNSLKNKPNVPTTTNELNNNSGFITNKSKDLLYYYTIEETEEKFNKIKEDEENARVGEKKYVDGEVKGEIFNDYENNIASNLYSHAEGKGTEAKGENSHAQNRRAKAYGKHSHAQNYDTLAQGESSTAMGVQTKAFQKASVAEGNMCEAGDSSIASDTFNPAHAEGHQTKAIGYASHTEGQFNQAFGEASHAEGSSTIAKEDYSHVEGIGAKTYDKASHAEGAGTIAGRKPVNTDSGGTGGDSEGDDSEDSIGEGIEGIWASHAEGLNTKAVGQASHSEGNSTEATGNSSHSEGTNTLAYGEASHTEGGWTQAGELDETGEHRGNTGNYAHAEGFDTRAIGQFSHTEGKGTVAKGECQHVQGKYNTIDNANRFAHIVGNGTSSDKRSNAFTLDWSGNAFFAGYVRANNGKTLATEEYVQSYITNLEKRIKALEDTIKNV